MKWCEERETEEGEWVGGKKKKKEEEEGGQSSLQDRERKIQ